MSSSLYQLFVLGAAPSGDAACWTRRDGNRPTHTARGA
jgi:hypothetical protein